MGESLVLIRSDAEKNDAARLALEKSVSFGRFESDNLLWEKWSSFSPNRYLEEVEKCATPGSVARKKAFFESRYKNVPPKKDPVDEHDITRSDQSAVVYPTEQPSFTSGKFVEVDEPIVEKVTTIEEPTVETKEADERKYETVSVDVGATKIAQNKAKVKDRLVSSRKSIAGAKIVLVKEKTKTRDKQKETEVLPTIESKQVTSKQRKPEVSKEQRSAETTSRGSSRKANSSSVGRKKIPNDAVAPQSLSTSLSSRAENRKPLIMETMKDKEIVKRAFKSFQKTLSEVKNSTTARPSLITQKLDAPKKTRDFSVPKLVSKFPSKPKLSPFK